MPVGPHKWAGVWRGASLDASVELACQVLLSGIKGQHWPVGCCKDGSVSALARFEQTSPVPYAAVLYPFLTRGRCAAPNSPSPVGYALSLPCRPGSDRAAFGAQVSPAPHLPAIGWVPLPNPPCGLSCARPTGARHSRTQPRAGLGSPFRGLRVVCAPPPPLRPPSLHAAGDWDWRPPACGSPCEPQKRKTHRLRDAFLSVSDLKLILPPPPFGGKHLLTPSVCVGLRLALRQ